VKAPAALLLSLFASSALAFDLTLDRFGIEQAIRYGQSRDDRERTRFHAPYRLVLAKAPVDYIDVITPFRRVALAAEQQTRVGTSFGQRQALEVLGTRPRQLELLVELTFHPMNVHVGVPDYTVRLHPATGSPVDPMTLERVPRFGPRVEGAPLPPPGTVLPRGNEPMLGGTIIAIFDGGTLSPASTYDVVVAEKGKEIARGKVELGKLR
jgi:hypothetical protein